MFGFCILVVLGSSIAAVRGAAVHTPIIDVLPAINVDGESTDRPSPASAPIHQYYAAIPDALPRDLKELWPLYFHSDYASGAGIRYLLDMYTKGDLVGSDFQNATYTWCRGVRFSPELCSNVVKNVASALDFVTAVMCNHVHDSQLCQTPEGFKTSHKLEVKLPTRLLVWRFLLRNFKAHPQYVKDLPSMCSHYRHPGRCHKFVATMTPTTGLLFDGQQPVNVSENQLEASLKSELTIFLAASNLASPSRPFNEFMNVADKVKKTVSYIHNSKSLWNAVNFLSECFNPTHNENSHSTEDVLGSPGPNSLQSLNLKSAFVPEYDNSE